MVAALFTLPSLAAAESGWLLCDSFGPCTKTLFPTKQDACVAGYPQLFPDSVNEGLCSGLVGPPENPVCAYGLRTSQCAGLGERLMSPRSCPGPIHIASGASNNATYSCEPTSLDTASNLGQGVCRKNGRGTLFGNPCEIATGNKLEVESDYASADAALQITRYYNSLSSDGGRGFGVNWNHYYERRLYTGPDSVRAARHDGQILRFLREGNAFAVVGSQSQRLERLTSGGGAVTGWMLYDDAINATEGYDPAGKLLWIADRAGNRSTLTYSTAATPTAIAPWPNLLIGVTDAVGRQLSFVYNGQGRIVQATDPAGEAHTYTYHPNLNVETRTAPGGALRRYHYESSSFTRLLTGITDENGGRFATWTYDPNGRAVSSERAQGAGRIEITYGTDTASVRTFVSASVYADRSFSFATVLGQRGVASITGADCPDCGPRTRTYDANGNVASTVDWNGNRTCHAYDLARNLETVRAEGLTGACPTDLASWLPAPGTAQRRIATTWHSVFELPIEVVETGRRTTTAYDARGNMTSRTVTDTASGRTRIWTWTHTYSSAVPGMLSRTVADGPRSDISDTTTTEYWPADAACPGTSPIGCRGQVQRITNALGHMTEVTEYDAHGRPLAIIDPNGLTTTLSWHPRGWLLSRSGGSQVTQYDYDDVGQLTRIAAPDGSFIESTYDGAHRLTEIRDSAGNRRMFTLDSRGNRVNEQTLDPGNALRTTLTREYNALGRLLKLIGGTNPAAQVTQYGYDSQGNLTSIDGPLTGTPNDLTVLTYDALNRLKDTTDPLSGVTRYGYSALDWVMSVTDPRNNVTTYSRNALDEQTQEVSPDRGTTSATYDAAGNLLVRTDARGKTATHTYDALNRLTSVAYQDGSALGFTYDAGTNGKARLTSATWLGGSTTFVYDPHGRVLSKTQVHTGGPNRVVQYGWDAVSGQLETMTYPSGKVLTLGYDTAGRANALSIGATVILSGTTYQPFGPASGWTWGNAQVVSRSFDLDGRITGFELSPTSARTLQYDNASRISAIVNPSSAASTHTYGYDRLDRLTSWAQNAASRSYAYDANGNRTSLRIGGTTHTYTTPANTNRLAATSGPSPARTLTYDAAGNLTGDGQSTWVYNDRGRMASATKGTTTVTYTHDSFGQRVRKTGPTSIVTTGTNFFVYDEAGKLLGEYNSTGGVIQEYVYLNEELVAIVRGTTASPQVFYVYTDQIGRPWTVTDTANQLRWQWDTSPFGEFSPNQNPAGLGTFTFRLRFPGQYLDQETGLFYNYFRDYDPQTGRYVQADPIGQRGGVNVYTYANLNPLLRSDRLGLLPGEIPEEPFVPADPSFCPCPPVPQAPPGVSCNANIAQSQGKGPIWVYQQSRNSGPFDYKQQGQQYEAFGNFNFGAIAAAAGLAAGTIQRGAGAAQMMAGTSLPQWGQPFGAPPYGDDPTDQEFINQGILYYICGCIK